MIRRPPRSTHCISSAASDVYKRQERREATEEDGSIGDEDDGIDELERLDEGERRKILEKTAAVRATVSKVRKQNELLPC